MQTTPALIQALNAPNRDERDLAIDTELRAIGALKADESIEVMAVSKRMISCLLDSGFELRIPREVGKMIASVEV